MWVSTCFRKIKSIGQHLCGLFNKQKKNMLALLLIEISVWFVPILNDVVARNHTTNELFMKYLWTTGTSTAQPVDVEFEPALFTAYNADCLRSFVCSRSLLRWRRETRATMITPADDGFGRRAERPADCVLASARDRGRFVAQQTTTHNKWEQM